MSHVSMKAAFNASADEVWRTISDFHAAHTYIAAITSSSMEGTGIGAIRTLTLQDGARVVERLESLDEKARTLSYSIISSPLPLRDYVSTMRVQDLTGGGCQLEWSARFEPVGVPEEEIRKVVEGIYSMGFEGLRTRHGG